MSSLSHVTGRKKSLMSFQLSVMLSLGLMLNIEDALVIAIIWRNNCNNMKNENTAQCRNASKFQSNRKITVKYIALTHDLSLSWLDTDS